MLEFIKLVSMPLLAATIATTWLRFSGQTKFSRSTKSSFRVAIKSLILVSPLVYVLSSILGISTNTLLIAFPICIFLAAVANLETIAASDPVGTAIGLTLMLPFYLAKQFVFDFPDFREMVLQPSPKTETDSKITAAIDAMEGQTATVVSPLRPMGTISVSGEEYPAKSDRSDFIPADSNVVIVGRENQTLIVLKQ